MTRIPSQPPRAGAFAPGATLPGAVPTPEPVNPDAPTLEAPAVGPANRFVREPAPAVPGHVVVRPDGPLSRAGPLTTARAAHATTVPLPFPLPKRDDVYRMEVQIAKVSGTAAAMLKQTHEIRESYLMALWNARHFIPPDDVGGFEKTQSMGAVAWELKGSLEKICEALERGTENERLIAATVVGLFPLNAFAVGEWDLIERINDGLRASAIPALLDTTAAQSLDAFVLEHYYVAAMSLARLAGEFWGRDDMRVDSIRVVARTMLSLRDVPSFSAKRMTDLVTMYGLLTVREEAGTRVVFVDPTISELIMGNKFVEFLAREANDLDLQKAARDLLEKLATTATLNVPRGKR